MLVNTEGLVIRETKVGDFDKMMSVLTKDFGLISVSARGSKNLKSRFMSGTQPFTHGVFTLYESRGKYSLNEVDITGTFFKIGTDVAKLALGGYFCELASVLAPENEECGKLLSLTLNALHVVSNGLRPDALSKAVYELRALSVSGFAPDLVACSSCAVFEHETMFFSPSSAQLLCGDCASKEEKLPEDAARLSPAVLYAMRFIVFSEDKKIFSFKLGDKELAELSDVCEKYTLTRLERSFNTLEFYNTVKD